MWWMLTRVFPNKYISIFLTYPHTHTLTITQSPNKPHLKSTRTNLYIGGIGSNLFWGKLWVHLPLKGIYLRRKIFLIKHKHNWYITIHLSIHPQFTFSTISISTFINYTAQLNIERRKNKSIIKDVLKKLVLIFFFSSFSYSWLQWKLLNEDFFSINTRWCFLYHVFGKDLSSSSQSSSSNIIMFISV